MTRFRIRLAEPRIHTGSALGVRPPSSFLSSLLFVLASLVAGTFVGPPASYTQEVNHPEYEVKAAYLYNFGRFVAFPAGVPAATAASFNICVLGADPFGPLLDTTIAGESIEGKTVVAKRIAEPQQALGCRILFISASEDRILADILPMLGNASVLTVSDMPQFTRRGGMIQFVLQGDRVRFAVNLAPVDRARLTLSSQLLKLAVDVKRKEVAGG